jgi:hypothetical protein
MYFKSTDLRVIRRIRRTYICERISVNLKSFPSCPRRTHRTSSSCALLTTEEWMFSNLYDLYHRSTNRETNVIKQNRDSPVRITVDGATWSRIHQASKSSPRKAHQERPHTITRVRERQYSRCTRYIYSTNLV